MNTNAAMWLRVSTGRQDQDNQVPEVFFFKQKTAYEITTRYSLTESAWNGAKDGGEYRATLQRALDDAWRGEFSVLIVWAIDRLSRAGAEDMLRPIRQFRERGCTIVSVKVA